MSTSDWCTVEATAVEPTAVEPTAVELMEKFKITGFLVVDDKSKLVGAFNLHDLFKARLI